MTDFKGSNFVGRGFNLLFTPCNDGKVEATYQFSLEQQGPPGVAHGGAQAAVLDEAMTAAAFRTEKRVLTVSLNVAYKAPTWIDQPVRIVGWIDRSEGRKVFTRAEIYTQDGTLSTEATGIFILVERT